MKKNITKSLNFGVAALLGISLATGASAQTLSQTPLEASVFALPNIMVNMDDSGSMLHITFDANYNSSSDYPSWNFDFLPRTLNRGSFPLDIPLPEYRSGSCGTNTISEANPFWFVEGVLTDDQGTAATADDTTETRCLKVPAPTDGGTLIGNSGGEPWRDYVWYTRNYMRFLFDEYSSPTETVDLTIGVIGLDGALRPAIPDETRIAALKSAATALVGSRDGIRWCASELDHNYSTEGNFLLQACADPTTGHITNIRNSIAGLNAGGGTPVAESYYKLFKYFREGYAASGVSPVEYRCTQNFAVVITDGLPNGDYDTSSERGDVSGISRSDFGLTGASDDDNHSLPNWDGLNGTEIDDPDTPEIEGASIRSEILANRIPANSDGHGQGGQGSTLYLDDFAMFANEVDMFRTNANVNNYGAGLDKAGKPWADATADAEQDNPFAHQNITSYIIGMGIDNTMLEEAGSKGGGRTFSVANKAELSGALNEITNAVVNRVGSSASSTATASFLASDNQLFQVRYDTGDWTGTLNSFEIEADPNEADFGQLKSEPTWTTDDTLVSTSGSAPVRNAMILDIDGETPVELDWSNLSAVQRNQFEEDPTLLDYILGDQSDETVNGGAKRSRSKLLGDIVHSQPVYVGSLDYGYPDADYQTFIESTEIRDREPIVYVGANDGFMHGFNADPSDAGGVERFAFMPRAAPPHFKRYDEETYEHRYFVDGKNVAIDAILNKSGSDEWATVLLSSMGAGARGMFALDVTTPGKFDSLAADADDIYLWEISNTLPADGNTGPIIENAALNGTASQASTYVSGSSNGQASKANDGNTSGNFNNGFGSVTRTTNFNDPWWQVELDSARAIQNIVIYNRTDGFPERLSNFSVFVSEEPFIDNSYEGAQNQAGVTEFKFPGTAGNSITIDTDNISGKYIRVQISGTNAILSLAEVQVNAVSNPAYAEMGHILDRPSVVRVGTESDNAWYAITGNGVHTENGHAVFYVIDLSTGEKVQEIVLDTAGDNGILANTAVDIDGDFYVDRVYLTDIKGNVWRLNANPETKLFENEYTNGGDATPMFVASETGSGDAQKITVAPEVLRTPGAGSALMVYFGTGKFYDVQDALLAVNIGDEPVRSFYGVLDRGQGSLPNWSSLEKSNLVEQDVEEGTIDGNAVRGLTNNPVDLNATSGWYFDLPTEGERVVFEPIAIRDRILLATIIPATRADPDPCLPNVTGWLMEVGAFDGGSPDSTVFDANQDGDFDGSDIVTIGGTDFEVAGIQPSAGAPLPPALIKVEPYPTSSGSASIDGVGVDSAGNLYKLTHEAPIVRTSWRRLN